MRYDAVSRGLQVVPPARRGQVGVERHHVVPRVPSAPSWRVQRRQHHCDISGEEAAAEVRVCEAFPPPELETLHCAGGTRFLFFAVEK